MIITSPTGLYRSVIPRNGETGNVTFVISSTDPPRTAVRAIQLPVAEEIKGRPEKIFDDDQRRAQFGELVFSITKGTQSVPGSNTKLFEVGEVLEFEVNPPTEEIKIVNAPNQISIQHNTNVLDLGSAGLSEEDIATLIAESQTRQRELTAEHGKIQTAISNLDVDINENQKSINEASKAIRATRVVYGIPESDLNFQNDIYQKLLGNLSQLETERDQLISDRNAAADRASTIAIDLLRVSEVVR